MQPILPTVACKCCKLTGNSYSFNSDNPFESNLKKKNTGVDSQYFSIDQFAMGTAANNKKYLPRPLIGSPGTILVARKFGTALGRNSEFCADNLYNKPDSIAEDVIKVNIQRP